MLTVVVTRDPWEGHLRVGLRSADSHIFGEAVAALKHAVPPHLRGWDPEAKQWLIAPGGLPGFNAWASRMRREFNAEVVEDDGAADSRLWQRQRSRAGRSRPSEADPYSALCLTPTAPLELVDAARRILAKRCHPDRGGSHEEMVRVNDAYDRIKQRLSSA